MAEEKKISFGFSKKSDQKLFKESKIRDETSEEKPEEKDYVLSLKHKHIESSVLKVEKSDLIIPLITKNHWRLPNVTAGSNVKSVDGGDSELDAQAAKEILEVAKRLKDESEEREKPESDLLIPVFMQNKIPEGFETEEKVNVALRPDESSLEEYDLVPIEQFGLAVLRGMGWKPTSGIGSSNKRVVAPIEAVLRPKGLGLGADPKVKSKGPASGADRAKVEEGEKKELGVGACVRVTGGSYRDLYGRVEGMDGDNARVVVKLLVSAKTVSVTELAVEVVSEAEYKRDGKLINKSKYEEYRARSEANLEAQRKEREAESSGKGRRDDSRHHHHSSERDRRGHRDDSSSIKRSKRDDDRREGKPKRPSELGAPSSSSAAPPWVRQLLRVRFIERTYKNGRYFNTKVIIEDVTQKNVCICRTESGHILEDIPARWLETIVPKASPPYVMVVRGNHKGQLAEIVDRDPDNCLATLQLIQEKEVVELDYDSICEYSGKASEY